MTNEIRKGKHTALVGEAEKAKILADSKQLLADLCSYRSYMCTTADTRKRMPNN